VNPPWSKSVYLPDSRYPEFFDKKRKRSEAQKARIPLFDVRRTCGVVDSCGSFLLSKSIFASKSFSRLRFQSKTVSLEGRCLQRPAGVQPEFEDEDDFDDDW
jgi:hypothetical protein